MLYGKSASDVLPLELFENPTSEYRAAAILGMLPLVIIYCCMQKYFIEGVSAGGVKE